MIELSIIVPTCNRAERLRACLEALDRQTQSPADFEVIVVVDGSRDGTMALLESYRAPYRLVTVWQENAGQPSALNRGIAEATGRYCLFIDDDILASPELVAEHLRAQRACANTAAIGRLTLRLPGDADWYARAFAEGWRRHYEDLGRRPDALTWEDCYSGNLSVPRALLQECGGFSTELSRGFDVELGARLARAGCRFAYLAGAVGAQDERKGRRELSRDIELAGYSDARLYLRDPAQLSTALGWFYRGDWRKVLLRRVLLRLGISITPLAALGPLLPSAQSRQLWHGFLQNLCYWRGVRRAIADSDLWARITGGIAILEYPADDVQREGVRLRTGAPGQLSTHLRWLCRCGYRPVEFEEFLRLRNARQFPPRRTVVVTADRGFDCPGLNGIQTPLAELHYIRMINDQSVWRLLAALGLGIPAVVRSDRRER